MREVYLTIKKIFTKGYERNTAQNIADGFYYGFSTRYDFCDCGVTVERFEEIKQIVLDIMTGEGVH